MDYHVQLSFDNINTDNQTDDGTDNPLKGYGVDHVKLAEAMGAKALRVTDPEELLPALETAKKMLVEIGRAHV